MRCTGFKVIQNWSCRASRPLRSTARCKAEWSHDKNTDSSNSSHVSGMGQTTVNGVRLHYEVRGSGMHPIICIPGALGTATTDFRPQLDYFGRDGSGFKIVSFDPRGYGASRPADRFDTDFFVADAKDANTLMQSLTLPKFSVLGWSDGGVAALHLAAMFPGNIRRLVIWGTNAYITQDDIALYEKTRDILTWSPKMRDPLFNIYGPSLQGLWSGWIDAVSKMFARNGGDICMGELCKIKCPTFILHGAKDPLVPSFHPCYLHEHVTGSRLEVMDEGKHNIHLRYSEEFNKMVEEFLNE